MNKKYNKMLVLLLAIGMIVSLAACGTGQKNLPEQPSAENAQVNTAESDAIYETEVNEVNSDFSVFHKRYEHTLGEIEERTAKSRAAVMAALERMGYKW